MGLDRRETDWFYPNDELNAATLIDYGRFAQTKNDSVWP